MSNEHTFTAAEILEQCAPLTGLDVAMTPFGSSDDLALILSRSPLFMAPMAGVTDPAYRMMARAGGAALAYSEMVSVAGLHYKSQKTWELVLPHDPEPDIAVQLFGAEPTQFAEAVQLVQERVGARLALIDINMACPMPKVTKGGAGAALMENPSRAAEVIRACCSQARVPVTAKIRRGYRMGEETAPDFARILEQAGAKAVAVHGRFANQLYRGEASWDVIRRVVEAVSIPVIGSGDVVDHAAAVRMREQTGCAAVMVARGSYGNPWVFGGRSATLRQRVEAFLCHVRLLDATGAHMARARSLAGWYFRGMPHAAHWRNEAMGCVTTSEFLELGSNMLEQL